MSSLVFVLVTECGSVGQRAGTRGEDAKWTGQKEGRAREENKVGHQERREAR